MRLPCAEHGRCCTPISPPLSACPGQHGRVTSPSQRSPVLTVPHSSTARERRSQRSRLWMEPKPLSRAARQQCTAPSAAANSDGMQPTDSASAVSDPHGSSGGGAGEKKQRLAVFVSGGGSNMRAIHAATLDGRLPASVEVVVSNAASCGGVAYAQEHGIPTLRYPGRKDDPDALTPERLVAQLQDTHRVDVVCLAGYMKLVPVELVRAYRHAMLNIHPALLPAFGGKGFYGERVHKAVLASGVAFSGATVHFVEEAYDTGPVLAQRAVPVLPDDTPAALAARVLVQEHLVYVEALQALCSGRVVWLDGGMPILQ